VIGALPTDDTTSLLALPHGGHGLVRATTATNGCEQLPSIPSPQTR
jgi:hypothetical protein